MLTKKQEFVRTFLPDSVRDINFAQIDLDISDLSLADILRNVNTTFPENTRIRNAMKSGLQASAVLCKTELLYPLSGVLLIITGDAVPIEIISKNYIVITVSEDKIVDEDSIKLVIDNITRYIIKNFKDSIEKFTDFYVKYVYDEYEMEGDDISYEDIYKNLRL